MRVVEVEPKVSERTGKQYWRVKGEDGTWGNCFNEVLVGQEGTFVKKGTFTNFVPMSQPSGVQGQTSNSHPGVGIAPQASQSAVEARLEAKLLMDIDKKLDWLIEHHPDSGAF